MLMLHVMLELARAAHMFPQLPQWFVSFVVFVSQPFAGFPSQSPKPALQGYVQLPALHAAPVLERAVHMVPHVPQLLGSVVVARHTPEQLVCPGGHAWPQVPAAQVALPPAAGAQTRRHAPQLLTSAAVLVSQPLAGLPSQSAQLGLQLPTAQRPATQVGVALARAQVAPQAPQWATLTSTLVSQPLPALQSPKPT